MHHVTTSRADHPVTFDAEPLARFDLERRTMETHGSFDAPLDLSRPRARRPIRRERLSAALLPGALAVLATLVVLSQQPDVAFMFAIAGVALIGGGLLTYERLPKADTVVVIGRGPMASVIASTIAARGDCRPRVALRRATTMAEAAGLVRAARCDEVIVAGPVAQPAATLVDARGLQPALIDGAEKIEALLERIPMELARQDRWLTRLGRVRALSPVVASTKRAMDLLFALGLGLVILPLIPLVALAIKLDSRGPVFYSQVRVGLGGRPFRIYKFRTMRQDAEQFGAVWARERDPRITRVGRFMRLTRIDELPQLWNVVRGEMAVVGPRPERPEFTDTLAVEIPGYELRHTVKPGLTGWAQVCYRYTSSVRDTTAKVEYDLYYVKHLSIRFDIKILLRTVKVVIGMKGQ